MKLNDFCKAVFSQYENYFGDLCPASKQDLTDVFLIMENDTDANALYEAFNEAEIYFKDAQNFFEDLSVELREMSPEPF